MAFHRGSTRGRAFSVCRRFRRSFLPDPRRQDPERKSETPLFSSIQNCFQAFVHSQIRKVRRRLDRPSPSEQFETGACQARRSVQAQNALWAEVTETLLERVRRDSRLKEAINEFERDVARGVLPPGVAASQLLNNYFNLQGSSDEEAGT